MSAIPAELQCPICRDLLVEAVMMPCCAGSACDSCARKGVQNGGNKCPVCKEVATAEDLIPYRLIRDKVDRYCSSTGYSVDGKVVPILPDIVLPTLQGRAAPPPSPRGTSPPRSCTPPVSPGTPLSHNYPSPGTPLRFGWSRSSTQHSNHMKSVQGPTLLPPSHILTQPAHNLTSLHPSEDPLAAFEAAMRRLDAKKARERKQDLPSGYMRGLRDNSHERYRDNYYRVGSPGFSSRGYSYSSRDDERPYNSRSPSSPYKDVRISNWKRESNGPRRRERCVADIPPETEEERIERERYEEQLAKRERIEMVNNKGRNADCIGSKECQASLSPEFVKRNPLELSQSQNQSKNLVQQEQDRWDSGCGLNRACNSMGRNEESPKCKSKVNEDFSGSRAKERSESLGNREHACDDGSVHTDSNKVTIEKAQNKTTKGSLKLKQKYEETPSEREHKSKSKKKKSKKLKKEKVKKSEYSDEKYYKKKKNKLKTKEKKLQNENVKPLVPYADVDETMTDSSVDDTEASSKPSRLVLERGTNKNSKANGAVSKQTPVSGNCDRDQSIMKNEKLDSIEPVVCKWDKDWNNGVTDQDLGEDPALVKGEPNSPSKCANLSQELPRNSNHEIVGAHNMLRRALANIIEKDKKLRIEVENNDNNSEKGVRSCRIKKKKKKRRKVSDEKESSREPLQFKHRKRKKVSDMHIPEKLLKKLLKRNHNKKKELESFIGSLGRDDDAGQVSSSPERSMPKKKDKRRKSSENRKPREDFEESFESSKRTSTEDEREVRSSRLGSIQVKLNYSSKQSSSIISKPKPSLTSTVQEKLLRLSGQIRLNDHGVQEGKRKSVQERLGPASKKPCGHSRRKDTPSDDGRISRERYRSRDPELEQVPSRSGPYDRREYVERKPHHNALQRNRHLSRNRSRSREKPNRNARRRGIGRGKD